MLKKTSPLASLYILAGSFVGLVIAFYRLQALPITQSPAAWTAVALIVAVACFAAAGVSLLSYVLHPQQTGSKNLRLVLSMGCITIAGVSLGGEVMLRVLAEENPEGTIVGDTVLLPREWAKVVTHRRAIWDKASREYGVFEADPMLGWTVGRNRQGVGPFSETYFSNEDGLRTSQKGALLKNRSAALRIAILGDSYTFGEDVSYEDTWGGQLEERMGPGVQVLNFGVPAYGMDQAYLRYLREVQDWHPDIVILSFISHDLVRNGMVYYSIGFPGATVPGAKPRFWLNGDQLAPLNLPLPSPDQIHSTPSVADLPFIQSDKAYIPAHWEWHLYQFSYLLRLAISWRLDSFLMSYELGKDIQDVSEKILKSFVRNVQAANSVPMVIFLPEYTEFRHLSRPLSERELLGSRVAREAGVEFLDLTQCLEAVEDARRFTTGWHYTAQANGAVAHCLQQQIMGGYALVQQQKNSIRKLETDFPPH